MDFEYYYKAKCLRVVDGDTVDLEVDLGFNVKIKERFRLYGINAPESNRIASRKAGQAATQHLKKLLAFQDLTIKTYKDKKGKFGRYLAVLLDDDMASINELMIEAGHAVEYFGGKR